MRLKVSPLREHRLPLHFAIYNKMSVEVRCLIEVGADVNARDKYKKTPLMLCCLENDEEWSSGVFTMLLQAGANVALSDANGRNALMLAVIFIRKKIVDLLLSAIDYNINVRDSFGRSAAHYAYLRGDAAVIRKVSSATGDGPSFYAKSSAQNKTENLLMMRKKQMRPLRYIRVPEPCKSIIHGEKWTAKIHKSSTDMNVHQFRRETMRRYLSRSARSVESSSFDSSSSSSERCSSARVSRSQLRVHALPSAETKNLTARQPISGLSTNFSIGVPSSSPRGWKESVPAFWQVLTDQSCHSYRVSATPVHQTFYEALGLPPKDEKPDDNEFAMEEEQPRDENGVPRRSSMSLPKYSSSPQPVYSSRQRRRSEAAVGLSTASFAKFYSNEPKVSSVLQSTREIKHVRRNSSEFPVAEGEEKKLSSKSRGSKETLTVAMNSPVPPLPASRARSDSPPGKRQESSRVAAVRNRSDSGPLQKTEAPPCEKQVGSNSMSALSDTTEKPASERSKLIQTAVPEKQANSAVLEHTDDEEVMLTTDASDPTLNSNEEQLITPRRRRRDSSLLPDRVLPDITEESEILLSLTTQQNVKQNEKFAKNKTIRCKSAIVRGQLVDGKMYR